MAGDNTTTFSFDVVACLIAAITESGGTVGNKQYTLMAKIDSSRTQSGYEHLFRKVKSRAKEINDMIASGKLEGVEATPAKTKAKATPKRTRKPKTTSEAEKASDDDDESPSKKVKAEEDGEADNGDGNEF